MPGCFICGTEQSVLKGKTTVVPNAKTGKLETQSVALCDNCFKINPSK